MNKGYEEAYQAIREMATTEIILENKDFYKIFEKYMSVAVYNKINGTETTIQNYIDEQENKKEYNDIIKRYDNQINVRMLEIVKRKVA